MKFKVGDRVAIKNQNHCFHVNLKQGDVGVITKIIRNEYVVDFGQDECHSQWGDDSDLIFSNELVESLQQENQVLKDRWNKLRTYITNELNRDGENYEEFEDDYYHGCSITESDILIKMEELEKGK